MRLLLALLLLASIFGLAWAWQVGMLATLRDRAHAASADTGGRRDPDFATLGDGWGVVVVGAPSGAEPVPGVAARADRGLPTEASDATSDSARAGASWTALEERALGDFRVEVFGGQTLFSIAAAHYGDATKQLCAELAHYNALDDAATLEVGETLLLPPRERLSETPR